MELLRSIWYSVVRVFSDKFGKRFGNDSWEERRLGARSEIDWAQKFWDRWGDR